MAVENDWPPRIEGDSRLNPIIPLIEELYLSIKSGYGLEGDRLKKLGNALIPHTQSIENTISIGDFIQIDDEVTLTKGQFWSFDIKSGDKRFMVERSDVWSGTGVSLEVSRYEGDEFTLGVCLQKSWGKYYLSVGTTLVPVGYFKRVENDIEYESSVDRPRIWKKKEKE